VRGEILRTREEIEQIIANFSERCMDDSNVDFVMGHGSFYDGTYTETSDIDFIVVVERLEQRYQVDEMFRGIRFESKFYSRAYALDEMAKGNLALTRFLAESSILHEREGRGSEIQRMARTRMTQHPPMILSHNKKRVQAKLISNMHARMLNLAGNPGMFEIACSQLVIEMGRTLLMLEGIWGHKGYRKMGQELARIDSAAVETFKLSLAPHDTAVRIHHMTEMRDRIIPLLGGEVACGERIWL
jgi:predicted nucleotidyltransferase